MMTGGRREQPTSARKGAARNKRATFGFLTANIHIGTGRSLWPAVVRAAERQDVNLICFPGGGLQSTTGFESQRNAIYNLIDGSRLDGLVSWASTVGGTLEPNRIAEFHRRFSPLPLVSLSQLAPDIPTVSIDSYNGMRAAITHLLEDHGFRRLAFIRGPERHFYAQERYRAYVDVLQEFGIPLNDALVSPPMHWEAGAEAVRILLEERSLRPGIDFQGIVAVSDLLALGALTALRGRAIHVPGTVTLIGFNDSTESRVSSPPLTTVSLPLVEQGARAMEMLRALMEGAVLPHQVLLPSRLVIRQSCGCPSDAVIQALAETDPEAPVASSAPDGRDFSRIIASALKDDSGPAREWCLQLVHAFQADLLAAPAGCFLPALEKILDQVVSLEGDPAAWQNAVSALRRLALPRLAHPSRILAENLFGQARVIIGETAQRAQTFRQWQAERQTALLQDIGQSLITTFDFTALAEGLAESLPRLGIASGYLALYDSPEQPPEYARLVLAYNEQGRIPLPQNGLRLTARQLVPDDLLPSGRRYSLVVEPLFFRETQIGYIVLEVGPLNGSVYETLRGHISSALKGDLLFQEVQTARLAAEKANRIKTRLLANVSHELRAPLNIILDHTHRILGDGPLPAAPPPTAVAGDVRHIQNNAEHQLRVINDLLDLSRAEIDELDLHLQLLDPKPLLEEVFAGWSGRMEQSPEVEWMLRLPDRLPLVQADPVRLRQILLNLLSNAAKFTQRGHVILGAEIAAPSLHLWVEDTGIGIPADQQERVFEPFITGDHREGTPAGIGLGLSITRHLVALHNGSLRLESQPGKGTTFHVHLPLPCLEESTGSPPECTHPVLLLISSAPSPVKEILEYSRRQNLEIRRLQPGEDWESALADIQPTALAWDLSAAGPGDWALVRRFRTHPRLGRAPFILFGQAQPAPQADAVLTMGLTSFIAKYTGGPALLDALLAASPVRGGGCILIVDDDPEVRVRHEKTVREGLPGYTVRTAADGATALAAMAEETPSLVLLDWMMPGMGGADVLDGMRGEERLRQVPVLIISSRLLTLEDVRRLEQHANVTFQSKGVLSHAETIAALNRALFGTDVLPQQTSALVKQALAYLHQNYARQISRREVAEAVGTSEDYLSRVFNRELGLSPWDYLTRYRILHAKTLLHNTSNSIQMIAHQVGFRDQSYFSRVFHKFTGQSPQSFRDTPEG